MPQTTSDIDTSVVEPDPALKPTIDNRHLLRQIIIQMLYEKHCQAKAKDPSVNVDHVIDFAEDLEMPKISHKTSKKLGKSLPKAQEIVEGILAAQADIDKLIVEFAKSWPLPQINPVDLQILRLAIYEGFRANLVPSKVAIDEAIELGKDFGTEGNVKFISGVLGNIYTAQAKK